MTTCTKFDEFSENFRKGGGAISDPKTMLRFFGIGKALWAPISRTKAQHFFPKIGLGGGSEAVWKFSENSSNMVEIVVPKSAALLC